MMKELTLWEKFLLDKRRYLTAVGAFVAGAMVLIVYGQSGPSQNHYLDAEIAYEKWAASPEDSHLLENMQLALQKVPLMGPKYEAIIAQTLINRAKDKEATDKAISLALKSLGNLSEAVPFHAAYAKNSLKIEQGAYQEALEQAVSLKEEMKKSCDLERFKEESLPPGSLLYVYNLIRIACLQQKLENRPGEKAAWEELEGFLTTSQPVVNNFREKGVDLTHYIAERKKQL